MSPKTIGRARLLAAAGVLLLGATACGGGESGDPAQLGDGKGEITVWAHEGQPFEKERMEKLVADFNSSQGDVTAKLTFIPTGSYPEQLKAAIASGDLPDVLDFDGPVIYNVIYQDVLAPIGDLISPQVKSDLIPSIVAQSTYDEKFYSVAVADSGLGIWGNKKLLDAAGVDYPTTLDDAWTADEFDAALKKLAAKDDDGKVLDVKINYGEGEWFTYGFAPIIQSAGGGLIATDFSKTDGVLNSPQSVQALTRFQSWKPLIDPNQDDNAFQSGKVALSWVGHWMYKPYKEKLGDDLVLMPFPDFGQGVKSGQGGWNFGITKKASDQKAAAKFLDYMMSPENVKAAYETGGGVPALKSVLESTPEFQPDGELYLYRQALEKTCGTGGPSRDCVAVPRPQTAAYPVITSEFAEAIKAIYDGEDVEAALTEASQAIDQDIQDNDGYQLGG